MADPADLDIPWTRATAASRVRELLICGRLGPLMDLYTRRRVAGRERPSEVMERVRLFLAECGAGAEREPHAEHADRRQTA
jgi:hypothetical protein